MSSKVCLTEFLSCQKTGEDHVDIITFYNEVFIPAAKPLLVEVGPGASPNKKEEEKGSADGMHLHIEIRQHYPSADSIKALLKCFCCISRSISRISTASSVSKPSWHVSEEGFCYSQCIRLSASIVEGICLSIFVCYHYIFIWLNYCVIIYQCCDNFITELSRWIFCSPQAQRATMHVLARVPMRFKALPRIWRLSITG